MDKIKYEELEEKLNSAEYVILDFSSPGCSPCKKVPPLLETIMSDLPEKDINAFEVDVTEAPQIAQKFFVLGVPTIIIFKNGNETKRFSSVPKKDKIIKALS